jgi:hypothetical protein
VWTFGGNGTCARDKKEAGGKWLLEFANFVNLVKLKSNTISFFHVKIMLKLEIFLLKKYKEILR